MKTILVSKSRKKHTDIQILGEAPLMVNSEKNMPLDPICHFSMQVLNVERRKNKYF
jgi:hypothetical protein